MSTTTHILIFLMLFNMSIGFAQKQTIEKNDDTTSYYQSNAVTPIVSSKLFRTIGLPSVLAIGSALTLTDIEFLNREEVFEERQENIPHFRTKVDDHLRYFPAVAVFGMHAFGYKGKNNFGNSFAILLKAQIMMASVVIPLKEITKVQRPNRQNSNSFPSGHTAQAFTVAAFMHKEYGHISLWFSVAAYASASSVGALRVMNNKHWTPDVFAGAAIGVLATNIAYLTHQYKWQKKKSNLSISTIPIYNHRHGAGLLVRMTF